MRIELLEQIARQVNGFHVRPQVEYDYDNARARLIFDALTEGVHYVYNNPIGGDVAEFGAGGGFSALTITKAMGIYQKLFASELRLAGLGPKTLHLFDSFEGLPEADDPIDAESPNVRSRRWATGTFKSLSPDELVELCSPAYDRQRIRIVPGWFNKSLRQIPPLTRFAMVHLDCDLYSSTLDVLDYLFGQALIEDGCVLFFDDWNCNRASPRFGQRRAWEETVEKHKVRYSDCGEYAILSHKFIVHVDR